MTRCVVPEPKRYKLVVSRRAAYQLRDHAAFAAQLGERVALKLIDDYQKAAESLTYMPFRTPLLDSDVIPSGKYRKMLFGKWYLIIYRVQDDTIHIEYVIDGRQDYDWLIE